MVMERTGSYRFWQGFLCVALAVFVVGSCAKDMPAPQDSDERHAVRFRFREFGASATPLAVLGARGRQFVKQAATNPPPPQHTEEGNLYYWSFNAEHLVPDIRVSPGAAIRYNAGQTPGNFGVGWAYDTYAAGKAMSLTGVQELTFELPLTNVQEVRSLGFDIGSSNTGPKSFALLYSQNGQHFVDIMTDNQFTNTNTGQAKNSFVFQIDTLTLDTAAPLFVRIVPLAGERGSAPAYNPTTGVMKLDNFRLTGIAETLGAAAVSILHYHIFDAASGSLVAAGTEAFSPGQLPELSLSLPAGTYLSSFVTNESEAELTLPYGSNAGGYFVSNTFSNHLAKIFGVENSFSVQGDSETGLVLERYYSRVKFEFTDTGDLSEVGRIVLTPTHEPYFYAPFAISMNNPVLDQSDISIKPDFANTGKEIAFHQFMGRLPAPANLSYAVEVYDKANALLRTFSVSSSVTNNVQLVFRGELLGGTVSNTGFSITQNEAWNGDVEETF